MNITTIAVRSVTKTMLGYVYNMKVKVPLEVTS